MPGPDPASEAADYTVAIGEHRFDPITVGPRRGRARIRRDAGEPDPADTRIVQFHRQLAAADRHRLKTDYGLALTAYAGNLAYVERADGPIRQRLSADPLVRAVAPYLPEYKLDPLVVDAIQRDTAASEPLGVIAWLFDGGSTEVVTGALVAAGATDIHVHDDRPLGGLATVGFTAGDARIVERATTIDDVRWIELQPLISPNDVAASAMIQSGDASNASVWAKGIHGEGQVIGVIDEGVPDIAHCFLRDITPNNPGPSHRKLLAIRSVPGVFHPSVHPTVHATFVAGCAAGDHVDDPDFHPNRGSAWAAKLVCGSHIPIRSGSARMLDELNQAKDAGAFIHTNSWTDRNHPAGTGAPYSGIAVDTDTFCYQNEDHVVLGSSGNAGEAQGAPGTAKNALCISAANTEGTRVMDGNPGPTADGRRKPDLVAVGCSITSADSGTDCGMLTLPCSTSWAAPHAAGAAALARQYFVEGWWRTGSKNPAHRRVPSAALLRAVLVSSAVDILNVDIPGIEGASPYLDPVKGWGLIRLDRALTFTDSAHSLSVVDIRNRHGLRRGEQRRWIHLISGIAEQLKVVLAYTEPPGTIGVTRATNTHLRLRVTDPNGVVYVGNDIDAFGRSRPGSREQGDPLNNIEVVIVNDPPQGAWQIQVWARAVHAADRQGFAIVATTGAAPEKKGCFVASAVYGDAGHPDVVALRRWRDRHLAGRRPERWMMRAFASAYERIGPRVARLVTGHPRLRTALRCHVFPRIARRLRWR